MSEINPAGGIPSPEHDPYYQKLPEALEQQYAAEVVDIEGELESFQGVTDVVTSVIARGNGYAEQEDEYNRKYRIMNRWSGGLLFAGGGTSFVLVAGDIDPNPIVTVGVVGSTVASFALTGRAWSHYRKTKKYEKAVDETARSIYPAYLSGIIGVLPSWARKSYERQMYDIPDFANDTTFAGEYRSFRKSRR